MRPIVLVFLLASACNAGLPLDGRPCPCAEGFTCCPEEQVCVVAGQSCSPPDGGTPPDGMCVGDWCWVSPQPQGGDLYAVWGSSDDDVWLGGNDAIVHRTSSGYTQSLVVTGASFTSIWGSGPSDVWAVSEGAGLYHYDGASWLPAPIPVLAPVAVSGSAADNVWVVGDGGAAAWNGKAWALESTGLPAGELSSVVARSATEVWATGPGNQVLRFDGSSWSSTGLDTGKPVGALWVGDDEAWAMSGGVEQTSPALYHYLAGTWTLSTDTLDTEACSAAEQVGPYIGVLSPPPPMWGTSDDLWSTTAVFGRGCPIHYDGQHWSVPADGPLFALAMWGLGSSDVWAVGQLGIVQRWNGQGWDDLAPGLRNTPLAASATSDGKTLLVFGTQPQLSQLSWLTLDGTVQAIDGIDGIDGSTTLLASVWADSTSDAWVGGFSDAEGDGFVAHYDGTYFTPITLPGSMDIQALWGATSGDVWAGSSVGSAFHFDGLSWSPVALPGAGCVDAIAGTSDIDVYFAGSTGSCTWGGAASIWHWDGQQITVVSGVQPLGQCATAVTSTGSDAWAVIDANLVREVDGVWTTVDAGGLSPSALWARSSSDVWIAGPTTTGQPALAHWDGQQVAAVPALGQFGLRLLAGGGDRLWALGVGTTLTLAP